jgi:molybdopterin converting factor small subunit
MHKKPRCPRGCPEDEGERLKITIRLHGDLRRFTPSGSAEVDVPDDASIADVARLLGIRSGEYWLAGINGSMVALSQVLHPGDEVELIPPMGGG